MLGTIGNGLAAALNQEGQREPALITFLVTASGVSLAGIGSAFWGLVAGALAIAVLRTTRVQMQSLGSMFSARRQRRERKGGA